MKDFKHFPPPGVFRPVLALFLAAIVLRGLAKAAEEDAAIERRIADSARYLASDELEGRSVGTKGLNLAAEHIAAQFAQAGLNTERYDATPFQHFTLTTDAKIGANNKLTLLGPLPKGGAEPERIELKLGDDFTPMSMSGSGRFDLPLVFVGYGITGKAEGYDDYAGIDVTGKAVVVFRHEPQQADPNSVFEGTKNSIHAPFSRKISNAFEHGIGAVIFCTDQFEIRKNVNKAQEKWRQALDRVDEARAKFKETENPTLDEIETQRKQVDKLLQQAHKWAEKIQAENDPVLPFTAAGPGGQGRDFPVIHCRRAALEKAFRAALGTDLATLERQIDEGPTPHSRPLAGWRIVGEVDVERSQAEVKNVLGVLEGEGPKAHETLVIGAHYDHLGWGGPGSLARKQKAIHNGADDNASGVAVLIEVAGRLAGRQEKLRRRVMFIAFAGEERGLLGSSHYVRSPLAPLENTVGMINLDMVGRLRDEKLIVAGSGTASLFGELLDRLNQQHGFRLTKKAGGFGPSDQATFYAKQIPVMHFFTGTHQDYHRPGDDFEKLNVSGMRRIAALVTDVAVALANADQRPEYVAVSRPPSRSGDGKRPYFGSIPDFAHAGGGYALSGVTQGGPAERAGLRGSDVIIRFGESRIGNLEDFDSALRKYEGGDHVRVVVRRGDEEMIFEVTLDPPR